MNTKPVHGLRTLEEAGDAIADVVDEGEGKAGRSNSRPLDANGAPEGRAEKAEAAQLADEADQGEQET